MVKHWLLGLSFTFFYSSCSQPASQQANDQAQMEQPTANEALPDQKPTSTTVGDSAVRSVSKTLEAQTAIRQGIAGKVLWESGNRMPSPDAPQRSGRRGVQRTVYVYALTKASQATAQDGVFYTDIKTKLVAQAATDADGNFSLPLEPGHYSLFTKEDKGLYANLFDGDNNIFPVEVKEGQVTSVEFLVNYNATY